MQLILALPEASALCGLGGRERREKRKKREEEEGERVEGGMETVGMKS